MKSCKTCEFYREVIKDRKLGNCFESPPKVAFIPIELPMNASAIARGGVPAVQFSPASARPQVFDSDGCARHSERVQPT